MRQNIFSTEEPAQNHDKNSVLYKYCSRLISLGSDLEDVKRENDLIIIIMIKNKYII
jgi:hypothetical protein